MTEYWRLKARGARQAASPRWRREVGGKAGEARIQKESGDSPAACRCRGKFDRTRNFGLAVLRTPCRHEVSYKESGARGQPLSLRRGRSYFAPRRIGDGLSTGSGQAGKEQE